MELAIFAVKRCVWNGRRNYARQLRRLPLAATRIARSAHNAGRIKSEHSKYSENRLQIIVPVASNAVDFMVWV
jgi:hypothetical protein